MFQLFQKPTRLLLSALFCAGLAACSTTGTGDSAEIYDPMEGFNRGVFAFNEAVDDVLIEPVARGYRYVTPQPVRTGVTNFLRNLRSPLIVANQLLQGDIGGTGEGIARFAINSTVGVVGLIDVAAMAGMPYEPEDFGQTLGVWGAGHGFYVVLPLMGPSSLRDAVGMAVDSYADPLRIYLFNTDNEGWHYARIGLSALDQRTELLDALEDLQKNSLDYYAALRSAYVQRREAQVSDQGTGSLSAGPAIPDYDEGAE